MENKISQLRCEKGLTQKEVATRLRITTSHLGMIENSVRTPSLELAFKIAKIFDTTIENIFLQSNTTKCCL